MSLALIHNRLAVTVLLYSLIICFWGLWRYFRKDGVDNNYRGALAVAEILILSQGALGVVLSILRLSPERGTMHILYGIVIALGLPLCFALTKGRSDHKTLLVYTAILFFNTVIVFRLMATG